MKYLLFIIALLGSFGTNTLWADADQWLDPNVLWRPREQMVFYLYNQSGESFNLTFSVRDMNVYVHAPAPVYFFVVGPDDSILSKALMPDDGITGGNTKYQDGIYDPFPDYKYRQYHAFHSPNGYPPGKARSPYLAHPEKLPERKISIAVPGKGKGVYRVHLTGRWDHFISIDSDRKMPCAVHSGTGPLALVGNTAKKLFLWYPAQSKALCVAMTEEVLPYVADMTFKDEDANPIEQVKAEGFCTFMATGKFNHLKKDRTYELDIAKVVPGMCLSVRGIPALYCPDKQTAQLFQGGIRYDDLGNASFFEFGRTLRNWAYQLDSNDLNPKVKLSEKQKDIFIDKNITLGQVQQILDEQFLGASKDDRYFGLQYIGRIGNSATAMSNYRYYAVNGKKYVYLPYEALYKAYMNDAKDNPYYHNKALLRRIYLYETFMLSTMTPAMRFVSYSPNELKYIGRPIKTFWDIKTRSNWYGLGRSGGRAARYLSELEPTMEKSVIPDAVLHAVKQAHRLWAQEHYYMHAAEVANQWGYNIKSMQAILDYTGDEELAVEIKRQQDQIMTPGYFGRLNPDVTTFDQHVGYADPDMGVTLAGFMPEHMGFDAEYGGQQEWLWGELYERYNHTPTLDWLNRILELKTHMLMPRYGKNPAGVFVTTASPTDYNTRTRGMAHKSGVPQSLIGKVRWLDNWKPLKKPDGKTTIPPEEVVPAMIEKDSVKTYGSKFNFIRCGKLYTILYTGPREAVWANWATPLVKSHSANFKGLSGMGYGGWGLACKPGAISGIYVQGSGAAWMSQNNSIKDSNTVWGHTLKPNFEVSSENVDPTEIAACYAQPQFTFDKDKLTYQLVEPIPYTPLNVTTDVKFIPGKIKVKVNIKASEACTLRDLHYSIPHIVDKKAITGTLDGKTFGVVHREPVVSNHFHGATKEQEVQRIGQDIINADSFELLFNQKNTFQNTGIKFVFDKAHAFQLIQPMQYRPGMPTVGSFALQLPRKFENNASYSWEYTIEAVMQKDEK